MVASNEISLILGIIISGLFYWKYRYYEIQLEKEELLNSFLDGSGHLSSSGGD